MPMAKIMLRIALWSLAVAGAALVLGILSGGENEFVWKTAGSAFLTGISAGVALRIAHLLESPPTYVAGLASLSVLAVAYPLALVLIWMLGPFVGEVYAQLWGTWWTIVLVGALVAACLAGHGHDCHHWRWAGVAAGGWAGLMLLVAIWTEKVPDEKLLTLLGSIAASVAVAVLSYQSVLRPEQEWVRHMTIIAAAVTALLINLGVWSGGHSWEAVARLSAASGIVAVFGALALAVLTRMNAKPAAPPPESGRPMGEMIVVCPCCSRRQTVPLGESVCSGCGLVFSLQAFEPRCAKCEYNLLYRTASDRCPECGEPKPRLPMGIEPAPEAVTRSLPAPPSPSQFPSPTESAPKYLKEVENMFAHRNPGGPGV